jgi:hypothetical protein
MKSTFFFKLKDHLYLLVFSPEDNLILKEKYNLKMFIIIDNLMLVFNNYYINKKLTFLFAAL